MRGVGRTPTPVYSPAAVQKVVREVERTQEVEYACEEAYRFLDQFAEAVLGGEDTARLMPLAHHHLEMCPDCREEFEALLRILRLESR
jgi:hypothetical protein